MSKKYIPVEGHPDLVRDPSSKAILNISPNPIGSAKTNRQKKTEAVNSLQTDVDVLKSEMSEIKSLLKLLLEKQQ
jgi:hypothetical protein